MLTWRGLLMLGLMAGVLGGCAGKPVNPSFPLSVDDADLMLHDMAVHRVPAVRPVVVLGGWRDFLGLHRRIRAELASGLQSPLIISVGFADCDSFETCRRRLLKAIEAALPSPESEETVEVDVVGFSMGGLVARYAAAPPEGAPGRRLRIGRLFTISTPHTGARLADLSFTGGLAHDMQPDSEFLKAMSRREQRRPRYPVFCYVRLDDVIVGPEHAAWDRGVWWVANRPWELAHVQAYGDPRIVADILRRLRGEPAVSTTPPAPLP